MEDDDDYGAPAKKPKQGILASAAAAPKGSKVSDLLYAADGQLNPHTGAHLRCYWGAHSIHIHILIPRTFHVTKHV